MSALIEKYRVAIGICLVVLIAAGGIILSIKLGPKEQAKNDVDQLKQAQDQISALQTQLDQLKKDNEAKTAATTTPAPVATTPAADTGKVAGASTSNSTAVAGKVNINTADLTGLDSLPGIGPAYAQRIIEYRTTNGPFKTIDELDNVKGIGPATINKLRDKATL